MRRQKNNSNGRSKKEGTGVAFPVDQLFRKAQPQTRRRKGHTKQHNGCIPGHEPTPASRGAVAVMTAKGRDVGFTQEVIARAIGIDSKTLVKHYADQLKLGRHWADAAVEIAVFDKAIADTVESGSVQAAKLYARNLMDWDQPATANGHGSVPSIEVAGDVNLLLQQVIIPLFEYMTDEQRQKAMVDVQTYKALKEEGGDG